MLAALLAVAALYLASAEAGAFTGAEPRRRSDTRSEDVLANFPAAGRVIILDNRLLSSARPNLDGRDDIAPNEPLTRAIYAGMAARDIAGLRIAESGRKLLEQGDYARALIRFERSLGFDSNPYSYYYLALVHYRLGRYQQALNFIEVAESRLHEHPRWIAELSRLRNAASHAFRSSLQQEPRSATSAIPPAASETKVQPPKAVAAETAVARDRGYLLLLDLLLFSLVTWVLLSAASSLSALRPR